MGGCSGFQVKGMIKWRQKWKPTKTPRASNKTQENPWTKIWPPKNPKPNFQKALKNEITRKIEILVMECLCLFIHHTIWSKNLFLICGHSDNTRVTQKHIKPWPVARQVWFYFIGGTMSFTWRGYMGTITNLQIVLNTQIKLPKKYLPKIS